MVRSPIALAFVALFCARPGFAQTEQPANKPEPPRLSAPREAPLGAPQRSEQTPRPYFAEPNQPRPELVEIGPDFALIYRPAEGASVDYAAGFAWGAHARAELCRWLGFRVYFSNTTHQVSVPDNVLLPGAQVDQPDLRVLQLAARIEPTWPITPRFRAWVGLGVGWDRIWADAPVFRERAVHMADRTGVALEYSGALGARFDVIPRWLGISLALSAAAVTRQTGFMFDRRGGFVDEANGNLVSVDGLPHFSGAYSAVLSLGLLL